MQIYSKVPSSMTSNDLWPAYHGYASQTTFCPVTRLFRIDLVVQNLTRFNRTCVQLRRQPGGRLEAERTSARSLTISLQGQCLSMSRDVISSQSCFNEVVQ